MGCTAGPSGVRRPPWEVPPSRRPIVQRPRADCEDDPVPGRTTRTERKALHNEPRLDDTIKACIATDHAGRPGALFGPGDTDPPPYGWSILKYGSWEPFGGRIDVAQ